MLNRPGVFLLTRVRRNVPRYRSFGRNMLKVFFPLLFSPCFLTQHFFPFAKVPGVEFSRLHNNDLLFLYLIHSLCRPCACISSAPCLSITLHTCTLHRFLNFPRTLPPLSASASLQIGVTDVKKEDKVMWTDRLYFPCTSVARWH